MPVAYLCFIPGKQVLQIHRGISAGEAVILAHSSNDDVQKQVAGILYGRASADGRLSASIGNLFAAGTGLSLGPQTMPHFVPEEYGINSRLLSRIDEIAEEGIREGAYPGCQIVVLKDGKEMYNKAFGTYTGKGTAAKREAKSVPVTSASVYDLASLTKTTATLLAVMKLYDKGRLNLTDRVSDYLPFLQDTDKRISRYVNCCCMSPACLLLCFSIRMPLIKTAIQGHCSRDGRTMYTRYGSAAGLGRTRSSGSVRNWHPKSVRKSLPCKSRTAYG